MQRQQPGLGGLDRPIAHPPDMAGIAQPHQRQPGAAAFARAERDRLFAQHLAEAEIAVDDGQRVVLENDRDRLLGTSVPASTQAR